MPKQIVIAEQQRIAAVFAEDQIEELIVAKGAHQVGDIYLGIVENVLPGIDAAFVNIGDSDKNGFIHVTDLGPLKLRRSAGAITELLAPQQKVLVQVMKEPTGTKGPRLTGNVSLPGRYLVLMPYSKGVNLSRRIASEAERSRLRALAVLIKPAGMGLLVRTEADGVSEEQIIEDLEALQRQWESILQQTETTPAPSLLGRDDDFIQRVLRDCYSEAVNRIVVDSGNGLKRVRNQLTAWGVEQPQGLLIDQHRDRIPMLEYFRVNAAIREALKPRVDLPSGGYIIIEKTEALTVIDVNSGSFTRSATARETVLWTNCEAAAEIARQLRLRNIAGVIVVDFIDMDARRDQLQVLEHFTRALQGDKARPQISQLSELGLVELTRKRQGQNIYELFSLPCPTCGGLGHVAHLPGEVPGQPIPNRGDRPSFASYQPSGVFARAAQAPAFDQPPVPEARPAAESYGVGGTSLPGERDRGGRRRRSRHEDRRRDAAPLSPLPVNGYDLDAELEQPAPVEVLRPQPGHESEEDAGFNRRGRRELPPPEAVAVEMTPEEQEIYAWIGVSPLVRLEEPVKDPQNTIVGVYAPGESAETALEAATTLFQRRNRRRGRGGQDDRGGSDRPVKVAHPAEETAAAPLAGAAVDLPEPEVTELADVSVDLAERFDRAPEPESVAVHDLTPVSAESEPDEVEDGPVRRRRRRRSSASGDEG